MEKLLIEIAAEIQLLSNSAYCSEQEVYVTSKQLILMRKWLVKIRQNPKSNAAQFVRFVSDVASPSSRISALVSELFRECCEMDLQELRAKLIESGISTDTKYQSFDDLPDWAREAVGEFRPNDAKNWVHTPVPALQGKSFLEVMNQGIKGETQAQKYVRDVQGKF